ncbi:MAG: CAP domain-containing protein [Candidatus Uhrbacteria bacterium]|nr:CAP domain-containing protein [Candidatus Uhrbacteria bacterium]
MRATLKKYFVPHEKNNYHPHVLHKKRVVLYGALGLGVKALVIAFVLSFPLSAYMAPDVLRDQAGKIVSLVNELRLQKGAQVLETVPALTSSSQAKADDMAKNHYFSHTSPDGKTVSSLELKYGYDYEFAGENLAMGFNSPKEVVDAWKKSATHYANLVDADFNNTGIGVKSGEYDGIATAFVAMHFGTPRVVQKVEKKTEKKIEKRVPPPPVNNAPPQSVKGEVAGMRIDNVIEPIALDRAKSRVYWKPVGTGTELSARARVTGQVKSALVTINSNDMVLTKGADGFFSGSLLVPVSPEKLFSTITFPSFHGVGMGGEVLDDAIEWNTVKVINPAPLKKYTFAKSVSGPATGLFSLAGWMYRGFIVFFGIALALCVFIKYKIQHIHVIAQTLALIGLFSLLLWL